MLLKEEGRPSRALLGDHARIELVLLRGWRVAVQAVAPRLVRGPAALPL